MPGAAFHLMTSSPRSWQTTSGRGRAGQGYFVVSNVDTTPTGRTSISSIVNDHQSKMAAFCGWMISATVESAAQSSDAIVRLQWRHAIFTRRACNAAKQPADAGQRRPRAVSRSLRRHLPPSMKMKVATVDQILQSSIDESRKPWPGVLIVVAVIFLFLASVRSVIIPVVYYPPCR